MLHHLLQLVPVHLHPLAFEQDQSAGRLQDRLQFRFRQGFALQRQLHLEIQQAVRAQRFSLGFADSHRHLRPRRPARLPPIRYPNHQSTLLEKRDVLQERKRLRRPQACG